MFWADLLATGSDAAATPVTTKYLPWTVAGRLATPALAQTSQAFDTLRPEPQIQP